MPKQAAHFFSLGASLSSLNLLVMAKDKLIDDRVSLNQCKQAVDALFTHVSDVAAKKADTQLLPDAEQSFWLTVALKKQPQSSSLKVFTMSVGIQNIPHSILKFRSTVRSPIQLLILEKNPFV